MNTVKSHRYASLFTFTGLKLTVQCLMFIFLFFASVNSFSQPQFFEFIQSPYAEGNPQIVERNDGGWYVVYVSSLPIGSIWNTIQIVGFDACGEEDVTLGYTLNEVRIFSLQDALVLDDGSFWLAFLSSSDNGDYQGLMVKFDPEGTLISSKVLRSTGQFYLYALDVNESGNLVAFGNMTGPQDYSVLLEMDADVNLIESKRILFTVTWGNFMATSDGGYMCRSGPVYYKVRSDFSVAWAHLIPAYYATRAPIELEDGYVFSVFPYSNANPDQNMMLKFGFDGELLWQSMNFGSIQTTNIKMLDNGNIMQIGNGFPESNLSSHVVFTEVSPDGILIRQKAFNADMTREMTGNDFLQLENGAFVFAGRSINQGGELIHAMTTPSFTLFCGDYYHAQSTPSTPISITPHSANVNNQEMFISDVSATPSNAGVFRNRFCFENVLNTPKIPSDTVLCIGDSLLADFRNTNFEVIWDDGSNDKYRFLNAPGNYLVTFKSCKEEITEEITIESEDCKCVFYFPNVITPNGDEINDGFRVLSDCALMNYQMSIFNRWGTMLFNSDHPEESWPLNHQVADIQPGVYIARITFMVFENGQEKKYHFAKDITVLK